MFPWNDGFHWTAGHIIFLSLFFAVVLIIFATFLAAVWNTFSEFRENRAAQTCWKQTFAALPEDERRCRHQLAGRVPARTCDNAFDCCRCENYANFAALPARVRSPNPGVEYSDKLLYHRGHTWVQPKQDGTLTIGLDEFARHLIGTPDSIELPAKGAKLQSEAIAWRMKKKGHLIQMRAPIDGTVVATGGNTEDWVLRLRPHAPANLRHLLHGPEVPGWLASEVDRLQIQFAAPDSPCLADGGTLAPDLMDAAPEADWDAILAATFLEP
jgi:glycine cleavage system H lipoate-binding protein